MNKGERIVVGERLLVLSRWANGGGGNGGAGDSPPFKLTRL